MFTTSKNEQADDEQTGYYSGFNGVIMKYLRQ